jgi:hypothetical protein
MVYLHTKKANYDVFGRPLNGNIWYISKPFGIFYGNLVHFFSFGFVIIQLVDRYAVSRIHRMKVQGPMLWSQIFRRFQPGVDVMITIFCDFRQCSAEKLAFFSKTNVMIKILHYLALI